jgi:hypothetical protein
VDYNSIINKCNICGETVESRAHFYKKHKITEKNYYFRHFPKKDLFTGEQLSFKSIESYIINDFNDRNSLKNFIKNNNDDIVKNYLKEYLIKRKTLKNLIYAPSHFEIKTIMFPTIKYINNRFGDDFYVKLCSDCGLIQKFDYKLKPEFGNSYEYIICDTREQSILNLDNIQINKLNYGDYTIENNNKIHIERKSLTDFCGTLSQGFDRFCRELERCKKDGGYLIIMVEEKFQNLNSLQFLPHTKRIKATPDFIQHQARKILELYPLNSQIVFIDGRIKAASFIKRIFTIKNNIRKMDLQYLTDLEIL